MHGTLPVYCETALYPVGSFPAEPVNTITSFVPAVLGVLALIYLRRHGNRDVLPYGLAVLLIYLRRHGNRDVLPYGLAVLLILTGLGSVAWHAYRTQFTLIIDAAPGMLYFMIFTFYWLYKVGNRYVAIAVAAVLLYMLVFAPPVLSQDNLVIFIAIILTTAAGLLVATWYRKRIAFRFAALAVGSATLAGFIRVADLSTCDVMPFGIHFFWHIFLGMAAYAGVRVVVLLRTAETTETNSRTA